jgi:hypothetical protein
MVRQAVVNGTLQVAVKAHHAVYALCGLFVVLAVFHIVLQDLWIPLGKCFFVELAHVVQLATGGQLQPPRTQGRQCRQTHCAVRAWV